MKKIIYSLFFTAALCTACTDYGTLEDTRVPDGAKAAVTLGDIAVQKYDATFNVSVSSFGEPKAVEAGVVISTESEPTAENGIVLPNDTLVPEFTITNTFEPGITYQARAYVISSNGVVYSETKSFTTASHPLSAYIGTKTLSAAYEYNTKNAISFTVKLLPDATDESKLIVSGLSSTAGVDLALNAFTIVLDAETGVATIPAGQQFAEKNYGPYQYVGIDPATGNYDLKNNIVGTCKDGVINLNALAALIVSGGNAGLAHIDMEDIQIGGAVKTTSLSAPGRTSSPNRIK